MHCVSLFPHFNELLKLAWIYKRHWRPFITHTCHTHTQSDVKSGVHPDGRRSYYMCTYNNRLSDLRSVSVTSVIWNECEPSITLCFALSPTISNYSEESGSKHLWWRADWYIRCRYWSFIRYHISDCHMCKMMSMSVLHMQHRSFKLSSYIFSKQDFNITDICCTCNLFI